MAGPGQQNMRLMIAGVELDVFVRVVCKACDQKVECSVQVQRLSQASEIVMGSPLEIVQQGWFVHDGHWYCNRHTLAIVPRIKVEEVEVQVPDDTSPFFHICPKCEHGNSSLSPVCGNCGYPAA